MSYREELRPCPFCGAAARLEEDGDHFFSLGCSGEDCPGHWAYYTEPRRNIHTAIKKWNRRALDEYIAKLEAQTRWEPVPNGYNTGRMGMFEIQVGWESDALYIFNINKNRSSWAVDLPEDLRLCKRGDKGNKGWGL